MADYTAEAEALFRDFAQRNALVIERLENHPVELLMRVAPQPGLSFEFTLGLQNDDELNIGFEEFRSYFFPFEAKRQIVADALDGLVAGDCRLAIHRQFGGVVKRVLERRFSGVWRPIYRAYDRIQIPFLGTKVSYLYNEDIRPKSP